MTDSTVSPDQHADDLMRGLYFEDGYSSLAVSSFAKMVNKRFPFIPIKKATEFFNSHPIQQITKEIKNQKTSEYSTVLGYRPNYNWQMDLCIFGHESNGYNAFYLIVDVYSRKILQLAPLKSRSLPPIVKLFEKTIKEFGPPQNVNSDQEFNKTPFIKLGKEYGIRYFFSERNQPNKNAIVERDNRTIAKRLIKLMTLKKNKKWFEFLPQIKTLFNSIDHTTTGAAPDLMFDNKAISKQKVFKTKVKFNVGDLVRTRLDKSVFSKGSGATFSSTLHKITKIDNEKIYLDGGSKPYKAYKLIKGIGTMDDQRIIVPENKTDPTNKFLAKEGFDKKETEQVKQTALEPREKSKRKGRNTDVNYKEPGELFSAPLNQKPKKIKPTVRVFGNEEDGQRIHVTNPRLIKWYKAGKRNET